MSTEFVTVAPNICEFSVCVWHINPPLTWIKYHAVKVYRGVKVGIQRFLISELDCWLSSFTFQRLYPPPPREIAPSRYPLGRGMSEPQSRSAPWETNRYLALVGIETRLLCHLGCSLLTAVTVLGRRWWLHNSLCGRYHYLNNCVGERGPAL